MSAVDSIRSASSTPSKPNRSSTTPPLAPKKQIIPNITSANLSAALLSVPKVTIATLIGQLRETECTYIDELRVLLGYLAKGNPLRPVVAQLISLSSSPYLSCISTEDLSYESVEVLKQCVSVQTDL